MGQSVNLAKARCFFVEQSLQNSQTDPHFRFDSVTMRHLALTQANTLLREPKAA